MIQRTAVGQYFKPVIYFFKIFIQGLQNVCHTFNYCSFCIHLIIRSNLKDSSSVKLDDPEDVEASSCCRGGVDTSDCGGGDGSWGN